MERLGPVLRLSLGLVILTSSVLVVADVVGLIPSTTDTEVEARIQLSETLATQIMPAAERNDFTSIRRALDLTVARNESVLSGGLRAQSGRLLATSGEHVSLWNPDHATRSSATHVRLPLFQRGKEWGNVELRFESSGPNGVVMALWERPLLRLVVAVAIFGFVLYVIYMRRTLRHLDPSALIPSRVQNALDVMTEGVILLDDQERIVLVNKAFAERLDRKPGSLLGVKASSLAWKSHGAYSPYSWLETIREGKASTGTPLRIETEPGVLRSFAVNCAPVLDGWEKAKGAIVTFDDVTELELKTVELEKSRDEIRLHAQEMEVLAKRDPLTGVANRRAFMEWAEAELAAAQAQGSHFCCLMSDIDHFKKINDNHGHPMGDDVIRRVAELFANEVRSSDSVCRYGGEEFCIAFPGTPTDAAFQVAERLREEVGTPGFAQVPVTMSFGVVSNESGATTLSGMLDQADKALYASKEGGRNRVTRFDEVEPG